MAHAILTKNTKYVLDIILEGGKRVETEKIKFEENEKYKKEYERDDVNKIIKDLRSAGFKGEIAISEVSKKYEFVEEIYKDEDQQEFKYLMLKLVPKYNKIDKYKL
jgi:hypothetical protein